MDNSGTKLREKKRMERLNKEAKEKIISLPSTEEYRRNWTSIFKKGK